MRSFGLFEWKGELAIEDEHWRDDGPENSAELTEAQLLQRSDGPRLLAEWREGDDSRMTWMIADMLMHDRWRDDVLDSEAEELRVKGATDEEVFAYMDRENRNEARWRRAPLKAV